MSFDRLDPLDVPASPVQASRGSLSRHRVCDLDVCDLEEVPIEADAIYPATAIEAVSTAPMEG